MNYWLMKSEPDVFSIHDLKSSPQSTSGWDGVRNYQARNFMKDSMQPGDKVLFYHSSCAEPGVAGLAKVSSEAIPDPSSWDPQSPYYDPKSTKENPRWWMVKITWQATFKQVVPLKWIREQKALESMLLIRKGQRLSIQPVTAEEYQYIVKSAQTLS